MFIFSSFYFVFKHACMYRYRPIICLFLKHFFIFIFVFSLYLSAYFYMFFLFFSLFLYSFLFLDYEIDIKQM